MCQSKEACRRKKERKSENCSEPIEISQDGGKQSVSFRVYTVIHTILVFSCSVEQNCFIKKRVFVLQYFRLQLLLG